MSQRFMGRRSPASLAAGAMLAAVLALGGCSGDRGVDRFSHLHGIAVDPANPRALWLGTHEGVIRISAEGTWEQVGEIRADLMGFAASPGEAGVFYSSGHPGPGLDLPNPVGVMVSRDAGESWEPLSLTGEVDFHVLAVSGADPELLYAWAGQLYRSEDGGRTWVTSPARDLFRSGRGPLQIAPHPQKRDQLLAATAHGLLWSPDQGQQWQTLLPGVVTAVAYSPADPQHLLAYHLQEGLVASSDGGRTWEPLGFKAGEEDAVTAIAIHPTEPEVVYLATLQGDLLRSEDGGQSWETLAKEGRRA